MPQSAPSIDHRQRCEHQKRKNLWELWNQWCTHESDAHCTALSWLLTMEGCKSQKFPVFTIHSTFSTALQFSHGRAKCVLDMMQESYRTCTGRLHLPIACLPNHVMPFVGKLTPRRGAAMAPRALQLWQQQPQRPLWLLTALHQRSPKVGMCTWKRSVAQSPRKNFRPEKLMTAVSDMSN